MIELRVRLGTKSGGIVTKFWEETDLVHLLS